jgi:hypothetical protein
MPVFMKNDRLPVLLPVAPTTSVIFETGSPSFALWRTLWRMKMNAVGASGRSPVSGFRLTSAGDLTVALTTSAIFETGTFVDQFSKNPGSPAL